MKSAGHVRSNTMGSRCVAQSREGWSGLPRRNHETEVCEALRKQIIVTLAGLICQRLYSVRFDGDDAGGLPDELQAERLALEGLESRKKP